jgi:hypothetical protein
VTSGYTRQEEHKAGVFQTAFERALMNVLADDAFVAAATTP